jgi:hypothetical protein
LTFANIAADCGVPRQMIFVRSSCGTALFGFREGIGVALEGATPSRCGRTMSATPSERDYVQIRAHER